MRPGDTLSGLAAGAGVAMADMAAMNGLDPDGILLAGTVIKLPAARRRRRARPSPRPPQVVPAAEPAPTPALRRARPTSSPSPPQYGVSPSLAAAIAWQESGFNNAMVSSANARGVMQVMPGTWDYVQHNLAQRPLDPNSATDNVHAGVLYLKRLLDETGGDESTAIAGYYQGLQSVRDRGFYDDTSATWRTCRRCARVSAASGRGRADVRRLVVLDRELAVDQEVVVLRVEAGDLGLVARERPDGVHRIPVGDEREVRAVARRAEQDLHAVVAGRRPVVGEAGPAEVFEVVLGAVGGGGAAPAARDHRPDAYARRPAVQRRSTEDTKFARAAGRSLSSAP